MRVAITGGYRYLAFDRSHRFFRELTAQIIHDEASVIPFVGAGLSHYGVGDAKLPLWQQLIERMRGYADDLGVFDAEGLDRVDKLISDSSLIAATDLLVDAIGPKQFRDFVRSELDLSSKSLSPAALSLVVIGWSIIVTTNLDQMLEAAHQFRHDRMPAVVTHRQTSELVEAIASPHGRDGTVLAKLHGTLDDFLSWCLTEKHYQSLLNSLEYQEILRSLFLKRLFFVGFGLSDLDFDLVQDYLQQIFPDGDTASYALTPDYLKGSERLTHLVKHRGLKPIFYKVDPAPSPDDPWAGHGEMYECLAALAEAWLQSNSRLKVSMRNFGELEQTFTGREAEMTDLDTSIFKRNRSVQIIGFGGEGKTSLVQHWVKSRNHELQSAGYTSVFGFSFYSGSPDRFIDEAFMALGDGDAQWDLARRLRHICDAAEDRRILFVMDGLEQLLDSHGLPDNPYLREFMAMVERSDSRIVATSRIEMQGPYKVLELNPLGAKEITSLFTRWGRTDLHPADKEDIVRRANGHALSLRLSLSMAQSSQEQVDTPPWADASPEDALRANKLERTLAFYEAILSDDERAFLICFSIFERPTRFDLIDKVFPAEIVGFQENSPLRFVDLRRTVRNLLDKRLLIAGQGNLITAHPNVRDYFRSKAVNFKPLHERVLRQLQSQVSAEPIVSLVDAEKHLDICHHAAGAGLWAEYHATYKDVLMRDHEDYLCDSLGAWTEALELTLKIFPGQDPKASPAIAPSYYLSRYARNLKHLGQAEKADNAYRRVLEICASEESPESALYANNYLTLQIYRGRLDQSRNLAHWNLLLLNWIEEDWKHRWQVEHGAYSIAWLASLQGDLTTANTLFEMAEGAWDDSDVPRAEIFDHYPLYMAEGFLCGSPSRIERAETIVRQYLEAGTRNNWPETIIRGHLAAAQIARFEANHHSGVKRDASLEAAKQSLEQAEQAAKSVFAPPLKVELLIERCRSRLSFGSDSSGERKQLSQDLQELQHLIEILDWNLFEPELHALKGRFALWEGKDTLARHCLDKALDVANETGHVLSRVSPVQSICALAGRLGRPVSDDLSDFDGSQSELALVDMKRPEPEAFKAAIASGFMVSAKI